MNILDNCRFEITSPLDCNENQILQFYKLVVKGNKVKVMRLFNRINKCELLAFCYYNENLIGVSAIKRPNKKYVENIINSTGINRKLKELNFEIGYSFTEQEFRRNGISRELKQRLLNEMKLKQGIIFSTTAIKSSQNFLKQNGFQKKGKCYDGENDTDIAYFEKVL